MELVNGILVLDKTEAQAIRDHIDTYGLSMGGMRIRVDVNAQTLDFIGIEAITLRLAVGAKETYGS
jgi:hypothetical protein